MKEKNYNLINKRIIFALIFSFFIVLLIMPQGSSYFTRSHTYWTVKGFEEVSSPITSLCKDKLELLVQGNFQTDAPVLHYYDEEFTSYISTHTKGAGFDACMEKAGTDDDLRCFCFGVGLHNIQDHFSHTEVGIVPKYISNYYSSNLVGHMAIENDYDKKLPNVISNDPIFKRLDYYDSIICDNIFEETGGDFKYLDLLNEMSGIDMRNDLNIFCNGYKGDGFFDTVYNERLSLPWWSWALSIGLIILGFGSGIIFFIFGKTRWKYILILLYLIIAILGLLILISFITGNTWDWFRVAIAVIPIKVSESDITHYNLIVQKATNRFLETGELIFEDNSGLSYRDNEGKWHEGALNQAEKSFQFFILPVIITLFILLNVFLIYKSFVIKKKGRINTIMNWLGWVLLILILLIIIGDILLIFLI